MIPISRSAMRTPRATRPAPPRVAWRVAPVYFGTGRGAVVQQWLDLFDDDQLAVVPELALATAWRGVTGGDAADVGYWVSVAERAARGRSLARAEPRTGRTSRCCER